MVSDIEKFQSSFQDVAGENVLFNGPHLSALQLRFLRQNIVKEIPYRLIGTQPQTAGNYGQMFLSNGGYLLVGAMMNQRVAGSGGTLQIEKCASGVAADSGVNLLKTAFDLTSSANIPVFATLTSNKSDLIIRRGNRLVAKDAGLSGTPEDLFVQLFLLQI